MSTLLFLLCAYFTQFFSWSLSLKLLDVGHVNDPNTSKAIHPMVPERPSVLCRRRKLPLHSFLAHPLLDLQNIFFNQLFSRPSLNSPKAYLWDKSKQNKRSKSPGLPLSPLQRILSSPLYEPINTHVCTITTPYLLPSTHYMKTHTLYA